MLRTRSRRERSRRCSGCGSTTTPGTRPRPASSTSLAPGPCGGSSWKRTMRSLMAIAPPDQAKTMRPAANSPSPKRKSRLMSVATCPPAMAMAAQLSAARVQHEIYRLARREVCTQLFVLALQLLPAGGDQRHALGDVLLRDRTRQRRIEALRPEQHDCRWTHQRARTLAVRPTK